MQKANPSRFRKLAFVALFGAMSLVALRLVSKPSTNLLQGVLSPLPTLALTAEPGRDGVPSPSAKFLVIEWTTNGVDLVLHRPEAVATDALEVTLAGSTNLVTATWEPYTNVTFAAGETNLAVTVDRAMLDAHAVSNACFFAFINSGDSDGDGILDWQERYNLGTDPNSADTDGDGLPDGWELAHGTDPAGADTDGDGLPDGAEAVWIEEGTDSVPWFALQLPTTISASGQDTEVFAFEMPFATSLSGFRVTHALADVNGRVCFGDADNTNGVRSVGSARDFGQNLGLDCVSVAGYWTDLLMRTALQSSISFGTAVHGGETYFVVEYDDVGFFTGTSNHVSFQVSVPASSPDIVRVRYGSVVDARSVAVVSVGAQGGRDDDLENVPKLPMHYGAPPAIEPGTVLTYHFGAGGSPFLADTDGDGLSDADEAALGTNPCRMDTDGDGLPDGWEVENLLDPLSSDGEDGADGDPDDDGLSNFGEWLHGSDPLVPDTDGDGVNDSAEVLAGSNPNDRSDNGAPPPASAVKTLNFNIHGDYAAWEMTVKGLGPDDTRVRRISMGAPGASPTFPLDVRNGNSYKLTMKWLNSDGHDYDGLGPWYCWQAKINGLPSTCSYEERSCVRIPVNQIVVGDGWFVENDDGLLTDHVCQNTADGAGNVAEKLEAKLHVVDFAIVSDSLRSYDECVDGNLIDSRTATVTVSPVLACAGRHAITFDSAPALPGTLVNDGMGTSVTFSKRGENTWQSTPFYWYGVFPDRECYRYHNPYTVSMKVDGQTVLTRECPVHFPERNAHPFWRRPTTNGTHPGTPTYYGNLTTGGFWYCNIEFVDFDKSFEGFIYTDPNENMQFSWSGQYFDETKEEEEFHLKQYRGLVSTSLGGQGDCFTVKGLKYFIAKQAITNSNIATSTWLVKGNTEQLARDNCWQVIHEAIAQEIAISNQIMDDDRAFMELKVKEQVHYNAAFRYHCTYLEKYGASPTNHVHPAYAGDNQ